MNSLFLTKTKLAGLKYITFALNFTVNIFNFGYSDFPVFYPSLFDILYSFLGFNLEQGTKNEMSQKTTSF